MERNKNWLRCPICLQGYSSEASPLWSLLRVERVRWRAGASAGYPNLALLQESGLDADHGRGPQAENGAGGSPKNADGDLDPEAVIRGQVAGPDEVLVLAPYMRGRVSNGRARDMDSPDSRNLPAEAVDALLSIAQKIKRGPVGNVTAPRGAAGMVTDAIRHQTVALERIATALETAYRKRDHS